MLKLLLILIPIFSFSSNKISFLIHPSPKKINWQNPRALTWSTLNNQVLSIFIKNSRPIGHVALKLSCNDGRFLDYAGMTTLDKKEGRRLTFKNKSGLGSLLHNFRGRLENKEEIIEKSNFNATKGRLSVIDFVISDQACERAKRYLEEFREKKLYLNYGLPNNPLACEGAGCSGFAVGILKVIGFNDESILSHWSESIRIPHTLVGPHSKKLYFDSNEEAHLLNENFNKVSTLEMLTTSTTWEEFYASYSIPEPPLGIQKFYQVDFYSPNYMDKWVKSHLENSKYKVEKVRDKFYRLTMNLEEIPVPVGNIWHECRK